MLIVLFASLGGQHSVLLKRDGSVWTTGENHRGQLGDGSAIDKKKFSKVISGGALAVAAGNLHSLVIKSDGSVWGAGCNIFGQLGMSRMPKFG